MSQQSLGNIFLQKQWAGKFYASLLLLVSVFVSFTSCKVYTFKDVSIPPEIKTVKVNFIENKARLVNPRLSPALTDRLQQKIVGQTRLDRTSNDDADWVISGAVTDYTVTTSGISAQQTSTNRLTVVVQMKLRDNKANKTSDYSVNKSFDFASNLTLQQAEAQLGDELIRGVTDEIFNRIFSNW